MDVSVFDVFGAICPVINRGFKTYAFQMSDSFLTKIDLEELSEVILLFES